MKTDESKPNHDSTQNLRVRKDRSIWGICDISNALEFLWQLQQDRLCTYNVTLRHACKSLLQWKSNKYYIFVCTYVYVALLIQHATCTCHILTSSVACVTTTYFDIISLRHDFRWGGGGGEEGGGGSTGYETCVFIFCTTFV
jgi:hypothetical protein